MRAVGEPLTCYFFGGAEGIRTPDPLHAMEGQAVARRGWASPGMAPACDNYGWMWPGADGRLATLAPNLAPSGFVSRANVRMTANRTSPRNPEIPSRHRAGAGADVMPMSP